MANGHGLAASLEEFGLSRYEAEAYVALVSGGTASAGELAYRAGIPRTKAYPTLLKLEKKGLATLHGGKPVTCTATPPEEAFDDAIHRQIDRVNAMNSMVASLRRAGEEGRGSRGAEEAKYLRIAAGSVLGRLRQMIDGSSESVLASAGRRGLGMLAECGDQLAAAGRRGAEVRVAIPPGQLGSEQFKRIPDCAQVRIAEAGQECFVFDRSQLLFVDGGSGEGAAFSAGGILAPGQAGAFDRAWGSGTGTASMTDMTRAESQEVYRMIRAVGDEGLNHVLGAVRAGGGGPAMLELLDRNGVGIRKKALEDVIEAVDSALRATCAGRAVLDPKGGSVSIESGLNSGHSLPWAGIVDEYLRGRGYRTRLAYRRGGRGGERVHIKIQAGAGPKP